MKRISLIALSATAAMAQLPAAKPAAAAPAAPVSAPVSYATAPAAMEAAPDAESSAPLAPIHDDLIYGNPALPSSIGYLMLTPSAFYGKREAAFQWNGSAASTFNGTGLAVIDQFFGGFSSVSAGGRTEGQVAGGYLTPKFGVGLRVNFEKGSYAADTALVPGDKSRDTTYAPTSYGVFGSAPVGNVTAYGFFSWGTPETYTKREMRVTPTHDSVLASRADGITLGGGVFSPTNGDKGLSWSAGLVFTHNTIREHAVSSDDAISDYFITQTGSLGKTFSNSGFILATGLNETFEYENGRGDGAADDWGYRITLQPTIVTILPIFEHWFVKGGTGLSVSYQSADAQIGENSQVYSHLMTMTPDAKVGLRYEHGRWAAETALQTHFLNDGPSFISGATGTSGMFASFGVTANFK